MQQIVTLTGVEKKGGNGENGPWTLFAFKDAGGNKFQTFDQALGGLGEQLLGQAVDVTYEVETRQYTDRRTNQPRTATNNVIQTLSPAAGGAVPQQQVAQPQTQGFPVQQQAPAQAAPVPFVSDDAAKQTVINRSAALARAVEAHAAGIAVVSDPNQLFAVADLFVTYIEGGSQALTQSAAPSPAPAGAPAQY